MHANIQTIGISLEFPNYFCGAISYLTVGVCSTDYVSGLQPTQQLSQDICSDVEYNTQDL